MCYTCLDLGKYKQKPRTEIPIASKSHVLHSFDSSSLAEKTRNFRFEFALRKASTYAKVNHAQDSDDAFF